MNSMPDSSIWSCKMCLQQCSESAGDSLKGKARFWSQVWRGLNSSNLVIASPVPHLISKLHQTPPTPCPPTPPHPHPTPLLTLIQICFLTSPRTDRILMRTGTFLQTRKWNGWCILLWVHDHQFIISRSELMDKGFDEHAFWNLSPVHSPAHATSWLTGSVTSAFIGDSEILIYAEPSP